jgi:hypothetical protein
VNKFIFLILVAGAGWYFFIHGRQVDEADVRQLYDQYWTAVNDGDAEKVCSFFDDEFKAVVITRAPDGRSMTENGTKTSACDGTNKFYELKKAMEQKSGVQLYINTEYNIDSITVEPGGKSATVHMTSELRIGTENRMFLRLREKQTDTVISRYGKPRFLTSDGEISL